MYPHLFRQSFATKARRSGMNAVQLSHILGHTSLRMIERTYSHLDQTDAYEAVLKMLASPSGRRGETQCLPGLGSGAVLTEGARPLGRACRMVLTVYSS